MCGCVLHLTVTDRASFVPSVCSTVIYAVASPVVRGGLLVDRKISDE